MTTTRTALRDLNANDLFTMTDDPKATVYVCTQKRYYGEGTGGARISYRVQGQGYEWMMVKPGLTDVYVVNE